MWGGCLYLEECGREKVNIRRYLEKLVYLCTNIQIFSYAALLCLYSQKA